jgi:hypothetical protein
MRMCGHAHHDDMLYLGRDPVRLWEYAAPTEAGYADADRSRSGRSAIPIATYAASSWPSASSASATSPLEVGAEGWSRPRRARSSSSRGPIRTGAGATSSPTSRPASRRAARDAGVALRRKTPALPRSETAPAFDSEGKTFLEAVMLGVGTRCAPDPRVFVYGEDVGGKYGNAFLLLRPCSRKFGDRISNAPIAEGACSACASARRSPGCADRRDPVQRLRRHRFNQLVNNAAKIRYRWGGACRWSFACRGAAAPRRPYHSQNTEGWFYRTPA